MHVHASELQLFSKGSSFIIDSRVQEKGLETPAHGSW